MDSKKQQKIFISNVNSVLGYCLCEQLRNDHINDENPHIITGSKYTKEENSVPKCVN